LLAWQRKRRYRSRCELHMYTRDQLQSLFSSFDGVRAVIEPAARDFFVTAAWTAPPAE
jgi:hypothetical protein